MSIFERIGPLKMVDTYFYLDQNQYITATIEFENFNDFVTAWKLHGVIGDMTYELGHMIHNQNPSYLTRVVYE